MLCRNADELFIKDKLMKWADPPKDGLPIKKKRKDLRPK